MSSVSAWSTAAAVPKYDGARHTRVSRHFCICGADLEFWVLSVVHILILSADWMEENKGALRVRSTLSSGPRIGRKESAFRIAL